MEAVLKNKEEIVLKIENLSFAYEEGKNILDKIDVEFKKGRFYAIVGTSGSGKTTFLSLISGLEAPSKGSLLLKNKSVKEIGLENYRNKYVSIVFQGYNLINYMTAVQNVTSAMSIKGVKKEDNKIFAMEMLQKVGLTEEQANQDVLTLSGGQQQRVAIARALSCENDIIIADEPTGNLDEGTSKEIVALFRDIVYKYGKTVIMVTHDKDLSKNADEIYVMGNKKLIKQ
ncbi:ABC transporter ATP-binding protein [Clostridium gasigenes]|uniref:ABC transporter ATP-binding protein n=1 Tax=Clostridium gasigenes TaxID=94869 RepID=UPI001C0D8E4B|nr:ABC transporter ATP-binding protein [Clostridium gasigenes]MBU3137391.1 ABC transporter ATP-binding protein [Clostridium gasigenes]